MFILQMRKLSVRSKVCLISPYEGNNMGLADLVDLGFESRQQNFTEPMVLFTISTGIIITGLKIGQLSFRAVK